MIDFRRHSNKQGKGQILILYFFAYIASSQDDCQVEFTYEAAIANDTGAPDQNTPFVGRFTLHNRMNDMVIESWRLAFQFTDQERINDQKHNLTQNVSLVENFENDIVMEWNAGSSSQAIGPEESSIYKFMGHKDISQYGFTVASISDVQFSNLECQKYRQLESQEAEPEDPQVEIYYKSIESMENEQVQLQQYSVFFIEVFSRSIKTINLKDLTLFYYFEGGNNMEADDFSAQCIDSKPLACTNVTLNIERGVVGSPGAQNQLQIGFAPKAGFLLAEEYSSEAPRQYIIEQTGASAYTKISLIIAISSSIASNLMNITRDYSFVDAPLIGISNVSDGGGQISLRSKIPNKKIPVYFNRQLIAGISPYLDWQLDNATDSCIMSYNNNGSHVCVVVVTYCCRSQNNERLLDDYLAESPITPTPVQISNACKQLPQKFSSYWYMIMIIGALVVLGSLTYGMRHQTNDDQSKMKKVIPPKSVATPHAMEVQVQKSAHQLQQQEFLSAGAYPFVHVPVGGVSAAQKKSSNADALF
eukprot:TRINITY_DN545_c0_g1_i2.p1 TRINITY_DN545_c0_g1~~TRINITY_DN545_c0_g1_i2.p1  ORF type:complete len:531 (+),score=47.77 TRINITY_DN545_c0_g1_i2:577-2169(+)